MTYGETMGSGPATTKLLLHLNSDCLDSSGNSNNGTPTNISYVNGKFGKCASFNGSSSFIDLGDTPFDWIDYNTPFTINTWINLDNSITSSSNGAFFGKESINSPYTGLLLEYFSRETNKLNVNLTMINVYNVSGKKITCYSPDILPYKNKWMLLTVTYDGSGSDTGIKFYFNSTLQTTTNLTPGDTITYSIKNDIKAAIGSRIGESIYSPYKGLIDETIIENRAWTPQEVAKYYSYSKGYYSTL